MATSAENEEPEEDATELVFGKGRETFTKLSLTIISLSLYTVFDSADALLISEVKMLLEHRKAQYETQEEDHELSEVSSIVYSRHSDTYTTICTV